MGNSLTIDKKPIIDVLNRSLNHVNNELTTSGICKSDVKQKLKVKIKGDLTMEILILVNLCWLGVGLYTYLTLEN